MHPSKLHLYQTLTNGLVISDTNSSVRIALFYHFLENALCIIEVRYWLF